MYGLTEQEEQNFINYMVDTIGVRNHSTLHDALCWARIWVIEGGYPEADSLWEAFTTKATRASLTNYFEKNFEPLPKNVSTMISVANSKLV